MGEENSMFGKVFLQVNGEYQPMMELTETPDVTSDPQEEKNFDWVSVISSDAERLAYTLRIRTVKRLIRKLLGIRFTGPYRRRNVGKAIRMMYWATERSGRRRVK